MALKTINKLAKKNADSMHHSPITIGFLGDSVTLGGFEVESVMVENTEALYGVVEQESGFVSLVRKKLSILYPQAPVNIINAGIGGDNAANGLARLDRDLLRYYPDLTIVCYGLNDCNGGIHGLNVFQDSISGIVRRLKDVGSEVILMTPQPVCTRVHPKVTGDSLINVAKKLTDLFRTGVYNRYMDTIRIVAQEEQVPICDVFQEWIYLYEGGVDITDLLCNYLNHPRREMHELFAWKLIEIMFHT